MDKTRKAEMVIIAEDDDDDYALAQKAFESANFTGSLHRFHDGVELMSFLLGEHGSNMNGGRAMIILLDLNMPRKDGREALREIKSHPVLKHLPVVVLTTSQAEEDIVRSYDLGANSFVRKPFNFNNFVKAAGSIVDYWFNVVELPRKGHVPA